MPIHSDCIRRPANPQPRSFVPANGERYSLKHGDSWESLAKNNKMDAWSLIRFNYSSLPPDKFHAAKEVNWYLQEYVGCKTLTFDHKNYTFEGASPGVLFVPKAAPSIQLNYWRSKIAIPFMYGEMIKNAQSPEVKAIKEAMNAPLQYEDVMGEPGAGAARAGAIIGGTLRAALMWRNLVRGGAKWDHKKQLRIMLKLDTVAKELRAFPINGDPDHEYYYDIWSNIHYGYVGRAADFSGSTLQWGAAQGGAAGQNDPIDIETVQIGIDLWDLHGLNLTEAQLTQEILQRKDKLLKLQETDAYLKTLDDPTFRHVQQITDGQ